MNTPRVSQAATVRVHTKKYLYALRWGAIKSSAGSAKVADMFAARRDSGRVAQEVTQRENTKGTAKVMTWAAA
jgi:hypothetical protein